MNITLVMFDIDGTLTESSDLDSATYIDALRDVFGFRDVSDDWASYPHATDSGILAELFRVRLQRRPTPEETERMERHYVPLLAKRIAAAGGLRPIPGAAEILARLVDDPRYAVSLATGACRASAELKLRSAGLPVDEFPAAFANDDPSREGICRASRQRVEAAAGQAFERVVYIGDGVWDVKTSRNLGYGFVGIGHEGGTEKLRAEGAQKILPDFRDAEAFLACLASADPLAADGQPSERQSA